MKAFTLKYSRKVERDLLDVMDVGVADVPDFQAGRFHLILEPDEILIGGFIAASPDVDVAASELIDELQVVVGCVGTDGDERKRSLSCSKTCCADSK